MTPPTISGSRALALIAIAGAGVIRPAQADRWTSGFAVDKSDLGPTGRNPYFILEPGFRHAYQDGDVRLVISVLEETRTVDGVTTRIVEENETKAGKPVEVSRNYFAISRRTGDVYYFGEDVDIYEGSRVVNHEGSWLSGVGGARFGLMMPARPAVGFRHYQELAPAVALDRAEIQSTSASVIAPAGRFRDCLKVEETTPLEPGVKEFKYYAPGVGLVQDGSLKLVRYGPKAGR